MSVALNEDHCWHTGGTGTDPLVNGHIPVKCCNCGVSAMARMELRPLPGHGPHFTMVQLVLPRKQVCHFIQ